MAVFCLAPAFGVVPQRTHLYDGSTPNGYFEDSNDVWTFLLSQPQVGSKEGSCLRGVVFHDEALHPTQLNVQEIHGLVLDVDEFDGQPVFNPQEIARRLFNHRHIVHTTFNSTAAAPRYRVILPLAQPIPRSQFRALWELVNNDLGNVIGSRQWNADRLGYLPRLPSEAARADYRWWIHEGPTLDPYVRYGQLAEAPDRVSIFGIQTHPVDRSLWLDDAEALARARAYMRDAHAGVNPGARHHKLFEKACQLWWDFHLDLDDVTAVLREINSRFTVPKTDIEVLREAEAGFEWTRGQHARPQSVPAGSRRQRPEPVSLGKIQDLGRRVRRRNGQRELGDALVLLSEREAFSRPEDALSLSRTLARTLAENFPQAEPHQVASLFGPSLSLMQSQAGPLWPQSLTVDLVQQVFIARQAELQNARRSEQEAEAMALASRIASAFRGNRSAPYTSDELQEYARQHRCTLADLRKRFVIAYGPSHYYFLGGTYTAPAEHDPELVGKDALAALQPFGVECYRTGRDGAVRLKTSKELCHDYGTVADNLVVDFTASHSFFDEDASTFHQAACPIRPSVKPERVPEIEAWLQTIGSETLLDWLAFLPNLSHPAKALYLWGDPHTGKSFLPMLCSRLWTTVGPTVGENLLADFNDSVARCPLIFCDEQLPVDFRGRRGTERLRKEIQAMSRPYNAKHKKTATMFGALRFVVAGNHPDLIETDDTLTTADVEGIRQRLDVVKMPLASKDYLLRLGRARTDRWLSDDLFAKHILYLRDTRDLPTIGRFGPERAPSEDAQRVHTSLRFSGFLDYLMRWFYLAVTGDMPPPPGAIVWAQDRATGRPGMLVNVDAVAASWNMILGNSVPSAAKSSVLMKAVEAVRLGTTRAMTPNRQRRRFHVIDLDAMDAWMGKASVDKEFFAERVGAVMTKGVQQFVLDGADGTSVEVTSDA